jgi:hypothetical protein
MRTSTILSIWPLNFRPACGRSLWRRPPQQKPSGDAPNGALDNGFIRSNSSAAADDPRDAGHKPALPQKVP